MDTTRNGLDVIVSRKSNTWIRNIQKTNSKLKLTRCITSSPITKTTGSTQTNQQINTQFGWISIGYLSPTIPPRRRNFQKQVIKTPLKN